MRTSAGLGAAIGLGIACVFACGHAPEQDAAKSTAAAVLATQRGKEVPASAAKKLVPVALFPVGSTRDSSGAIALVRDEATHYVALVDEDEQVLRLLSAEDGHPIAAVKLPGRPGHVVAHQGGLIVALRDQAKLAQVMLRRDARGGKEFEIDGFHASLHDPLALAAGPDASLGVVGAASAEFQRFDKNWVARVPVRIAREPRAIAFDERGVAVISHATAGVLTQVDTEGHATSADASLGQVCTRIASDECLTTVNQPATQSFAMARVGSAFFVPTVSSLTDGPFDEGGGTPKMASTGKPRALTTAELMGGGGRGGSGYGGAGSRSIPIHMRVDVVVSEAGQLRFDAHRFGSHDCTLPRGIVASEDGRDVYVACLGEGRVDHYSVEKAQAKRTPFPKLKKVASTRVPHARDLAFDPASGTLVVYAAHARSVHFLRNHAEVAHNVLPATEALSAEALRGRQLFHDTSVNVSRGKKACASCHPDGGDDGLAWATDRGLRRTLPLAGSVTSKFSGPAFGWDAQSPSLREHIAHTITKNLHGKGVGDDGTSALIAYIDSMPAPPPGETSELALRGKAIFSSDAAQCAGCHIAASAFTNGRAYDVKSGGKFKTPSLRGLVGRAKLFHDGRYRTLDELLRGSGGAMGGKVSDADRPALVAYLETL